MNTKKSILLKDSQLGKDSQYIFEYTPELLFPIPRSHNRDTLQISEALPFYGFDIWNAYELSWLNEKGKPEVAIAEFIIPCITPNIVESKSIKLYLNTLTNTKFDSADHVKTTIEKDLSNAAAAGVTVKLHAIDDTEQYTPRPLNGICIDTLDIAVNDYEVNANLLSAETTATKETLFSHLLKSNCPATGQPDWASIIVDYQGPKINHESLLRYIISFRNHTEFHEQCVERIFMDIMRQCSPEHLTVKARYTRRGGIDINPVRSTNTDINPSNCRSIRQ